jgi:hypothetical protein
VLPRAVATARAALESRARTVRDQRRRDWVSRLRESASAQWAAVAPTREPPVHVLHIDGQWISDPEAMDAAVQAVWLPIYRLQDHGKPPPLTWNAFRRKYGHSIAKAPGNWDPLSAADLRRALLATNPRSSMGLDGWRPRELKTLPDPALQCLAWVLEGCVARQEWPPALLEAATTLIPKGEGMAPGDLRPIGVLSAVYRLWASAWATRMAPWQEAWASPALVGFRRGISTQDVWWKLAFHVEEAALSGRPIAGVKFDTAKAYDTVPW